MNKIGWNQGMENNLAISMAPLRLRVDILDGVLS